MTNEEILQRLHDAYGSGRFEGMLDWFHPDALICAVMTEKQPVGPVEIVERTRAAYAQDPSYHVRFDEPVVLDEQAIALRGQVRRGGDAGFRDAPVCWLLTFRDGLLYRSVVCASIGEARERYEELGVDAGL
jgi:SnoaL-like domain